MNDYPKTIGNIEKELLFHKKKGDIYCIGSRTCDKYLYAPDNEANLIFYILTLVNGKHTVKQIQDIVDNDFWGKVKIDVKSIIQRCENAGLIETEISSKRKHTTDEFELMLVNLKDFRLEKIYPFFDFISKNIKKIIMIMISVVVAAIVTLLLYGGELNFPWKSVFSEPKVLVYMWGIQFISLVLHEFSHAAVGYKYGAKPKTFSIAVFYYCTLIFFIRLPGIYFQTAKKRIEIWGAGIFMNLFLAACFFLFFIVGKGELKVIFAVGVISNLFLALNNLIPFFYSDGYYMLSTLLKAPNLRKRSIFQIKNLVKNGVDQESIIYWIYLVITVIVTVFIVGGQLLIIVHSVINEMKEESNWVYIIKDYSNLIILMLVGIIGKVIGKIKKNRK